MIKLKEKILRPFAFLKMLCNYILHRFKFSHKFTYKTHQVNVFRLANVPIKIYTIVLLIGISHFNQAFGQATNDSTSISKNTIYFEGMGNSGFYSINYDRIILIGKSFKIAGRIGVSYIPPTSNIYYHFFSYPTEISLLYGKKHHLELGSGYTIVFKEYKNDILKIYDNNSALVINFGYRFQKQEGGIFIKTCILKFFPADENIPLWMGFGIGYTFKNK